MRSFITSCNTNKKDALSHFNEAKKFYSMKDYSKALVEINTSISLDSTNYDFYLYAARIKRNLGDYDSAINIVQKVIDNSKGFKTDTLQYELGLNYFTKFHHLSDSGESINKKNETLNNANQCLEKVLTHNFNHFDARITKYKVLHNLENYDESLILINKTISLFPDSLGIILFRGIAKGSLGDINEQMKDLNYIISNENIKSEIKAIAYRFRGIAYENKREYKMALRDFSNSINLDKDGLVYKTRGDLYRKLNYPDSACLDYRKAAELGMVRIYDDIKNYCN